MIYVYCFNSDAFSTAWAAEKGMVSDTLLSVLLALLVNIAYVPVRHKRNFGARKIPRNVRVTFEFIIAALNADQHNYTDITTVQQIDLLLPWSLLARVSPSIQEESASSRVQ